MEHNYKIIKKHDCIEWINKKAFPFFRAFNIDNAIPFIDNEKDQGRILLGAMFKDSVPDGWELIIDQNLIYLQRIKEEKAAQ